MLKRDQLYLAVEHNTKYLCELAKSADARAVNAEGENVSIKSQLRELKRSNDEMSRQVRVMEKDAIALVNER